MPPSLPFPGSAGTPEGGGESFGASCGRPSSPGSSGLPSSLPSPGSAGSPEEAGESLSACGSPPRELEEWREGARPHASSSGSRLASWLAAMSSSNSMVLTSTMSTLGFCRILQSNRERESLTGPNALNGAVLLVPMAAFPARQKVESRGRKGPTCAGQGCWKSHAAVTTS